jgi:hypothetical protein
MSSIIPNSGHALLVCGAPFKVSSIIISRSSCENRNRGEHAFYQYRYALTRSVRLNHLFSMRFANGHWNRGDGATNGDASRPGGFQDANS